MHSRHAMSWSSRPALACHSVAELTPPWCCHYQSQSDYDHGLVSLQL
ncbi:Uncharacterised protein [Vibrio cholerae]|nr:Uncharacterised protein [Vibrio cholerae]